MKVNKSRVASGTYKGKSILFPDTDGTRPTKNIVKESVINTLRTELPYHCFVEVFAGSGSVGIEALSNGAVCAYFLEQSSEPAKTLRHNLDGLGCDNYDIILGNSFETITPLLKELEESDVPAIIYLDPPFHIREGQEDIYEQTSRLIESLRPDIAPIVVIEHLSSYRFDETIGAYTLDRTKRFGKTALTYFLPTME